MSAELWIAVLLIAAITYLSRALPFIAKLKISASPAVRARTAALGPCLLAAMAAAAFWSEGQTALETGKLAPLAAGTALAVIAMRLRPDPGIAALAGVLGWWLMTML